MRLVRVFDGCHRFQVGDNCKSFLKFQFAHLVFDYDKNGDACEVTVGQHTDIDDLLDVTERPLANTGDPIGNDVQNVLAPRSCCPQPLRRPLGH